MSVNQVFAFDQSDYGDSTAPPGSFGKLIDEGGACYGLSMYWVSWFSTAWGKGIGFMALIEQEYEQKIAARYMGKYQNELLGQLMDDESYPINSSLADGNYAPLSNTSVFGRMNNQTAYKARQDALKKWGAGLEPPLTLHDKQVVKFVRCDYKGVPTEDHDALATEMAADVLKLFGASPNPVLGMLGVTYQEAGHAVAFAYKDPFHVVHFDPNFGQYEITGTKSDIAAAIKTMLHDNLEIPTHWWWAPMIYVK
jgi:hypothetical protein